MRVGTEQITQDRMGDEHNVPWLTYTWTVDIYSSRYVDSNQLACGDTVPKDDPNLLATF